MWPLDSPDAGRGRAYAALVVDEAAMVLNSWASLAQHPIHAYRPAGELSSELVLLHDRSRLVTDLGRAYREGRLDRRMRVYLAPKVLIIDETGYLPLDDLGATIFFQLVSARYERGSIILTSNKSYGDWGSIFGDPIIATAILDRLLHHECTNSEASALAYRLDAQNISA